MKIQIKFCELCDNIIKGEQFKLDDLIVCETCYEKSVFKGKSPLTVIK